MRPILRNLIPGPRPNSIFHGRLRLWLTPPPFRLWYAAIRTGIKHTAQGRSNGLGLRTHFCSRIILMCVVPQHPHHHPPSNLHCPPSPSKNLNYDTINFFISSWWSSVSPCSDQRCAGRSGRSFAHIVTLPAANLSS